MADVIRKSALKPDDPRFTAEIAKHHVMAIKSLAMGSATPEQQKIALEFIISKLCQSLHPYFSENPNNTAFFMGRRFIGLELMRLINLEMKESRSD